MRGLVKHEKRNMLIITPPSHVQGNGPGFHHGLLPENQLCAHTPDRF